jgi:Domain of unknown function (DUF4062)
MSYDATVIKVFIASPSDVPTERKIIRDVLQEWNAIHSEHQNLVLLPIGWESHSSPEMGDRPQEIINKQILKDCDVLVATFWTRFGTPTGVFASGTAEEIEEYIREGKPVLVYFSSVPVRPDSVVESQYKALLSFKETCMERGIIESYDSTVDFKEKFSRQLGQTIVRKFTNRANTPNFVDTFEPALRHYAGPTLTEQAKELLLEATKDARGIIMRVATMSGSHVQTNARDFIVQGDQRSEAKWRSAVDELEQGDFIEDRGGKGEVFFVTNRGFETVENFT